MATGPQQKRKELREKRLKAEAAAKGGERREGLAKIIGIAAFLGVIAVAIVAYVSLTGNDEPTKASGDINKMLAGIPQDGVTLGDPDAPVTLVEFADLQCSACKVAAEEVIPDVIAGPVKNGTAKYEFANLPIIGGTDSTTAAKAALAASEQNRLWQFVENFYASQGIQGSGYVTDDFLREIAEKAGIPDIDKWEAERNLPKWDQVLLKTDNEAAEAGYSSTPVFALRKPDGSLEQIVGRSPGEITRADDIIKAINQAK